MISTVLQRRTAGRSAAAMALALAASLALSACSREARAPAPPAAGAEVTPPAPSGTGRVADAASIYDLDLVLTDQEGRTVTLGDLRGRPVVASMIYSSCTSVCPRITDDMKRIEQALAGHAGAEVRFVLFSLDPARDTPASLRGFAATHKLAASRWSLLAPSEEGVRELAAVLDVKYKQEAGEIAHSAVIFLIDRDGVIRHRQLGLNQDPKEFVAAVLRL